MSTPSMTTAPPPTERERLLGLAADEIRRECGIRVPSHRWPILEAELIRLSAAPLATGLDRLRSDNDLRERLIGVLAIPETYLFRHPGHFDALAELARVRHAAGRTCRVLSAGCATGEEAWSAAAVLAGVYLPLRRDILVEGWDIDPARVRIARLGRFRSWAARAGLHGHERFFRRQQDGWEAESWLHELVRFEPVNLIREPLPSGPAFDAVLFRNVTIYWDAATAAAVAERLAARLAPDGLFLVGPGDPLRLPANEWDLSLEGAVLTYRRRGGRGRAKPRPARATRAPERKPRSVSSPPLRVVAPVATPEPAAAASPALEDDPDGRWLAEVAALADRGRYEEALERTRARNGSLPPAGRLMTGILLVNLDRTEEALDWIRQAVFLEPEHSDGRHWLALALERVGRTAEAERERRNALEMRGDGDRL